MVQGRAPLVVDTARALKRQTLTVPLVVGTWVGASVGADVRTVVGTWVGAVVRAVVGAEVVPGACASTWYTFEPGAMMRAPGHSGGEEVVGC